MINNLCQQINQYTTIVQGILEQEEAAQESSIIQRDFQSQSKRQKISLICQNIIQFIKEHESQIKEIESESLTDNSQLALSLTDLYSHVKTMKSHDRLIGFTFMDHQVGENIASVENTIRTLCLQIGAPDPSLKKRIICMFNSLIDLSLDATYKKDLIAYLRSQIGILELYELVKPFYMWVLQEKKAGTLRNEVGLVQAERHIEQIFLQYRRLSFKKDIVVSADEKKLHQKLDEYFFNLSKKAIKGSLDTISKLIAVPQPVFNKEDVSQLIEIISQYVGPTQDKHRAKIRKLLQAHIAHFHAWHTSITSSVDFKSRLAAINRGSSIVGEMHQSIFTQSLNKTEYLTLSEAEKNSKAVDTISFFMLTYFDPKAIPRIGNQKQNQLNAPAFKQLQDLLLIIQQLSDSTPFPFSIQKTNEKELTMKETLEHVLKNIDHFHDFFFDHVNLKDIMTTFDKRSKNQDQKRLYRFVYQKLKEIDPQFTHKNIVVPDLFDQKLSSLALTENTLSERYTDDILNKAAQAKKTYEHSLHALLEEPTVNKKKGAKEKKSNQSSQKSEISKLAEGIKNLSLQSKKTTSTQPKESSSQNITDKRLIKNKKVEKLTPNTSSSRTTHQEKQHLTAQNITTLCNFVRHPRVTRWKELGAQVCYRDPKYSETDESEYEEIALRHDIPHEATQYVLENSMPLSQKSSYGTHNLYLRKATIEWRERKIDVIIEIAINTDGTIFHEYASPVKDTFWHRLLELSQLNTSNGVLGKDPEVSSVWNYASSSIKRVEDNTSVQFVDSSRDLAITFLK